MASIIRPTLLRPTLGALAAKRATAIPFTPATASAFLTTSSYKTQPASQACMPPSRGASFAHPKPAAFHTTTKREILPPLPQRLSGTVNDAAIVPDPSPSHGAYHWTFERLVSAALVPLTIAPFIGGSMNPIMDATLCGLLVVHSHIGFQSCIIDYFPKKRVPKTRTSLMWTLRIATLATAVGLYEFETNDVGITEGIKRVWTA